MATDPKTFLSNKALEYYNGPNILNSIDGSTGGVINFVYHPSGAVRLSGVQTPIGAADVATKNYVDSVAIGLSWITAAKAGTTGNVNIGADLNVGEVVDGYTIQGGDRILVLAQTDPVENGVYVSGGARASDMANGATMDSLALTVTDGTVNKDKTFVNTTDGLVGTDPVVFTVLGVGTGTPAGTDGELQYNNNGQLGGTSTLLYDGTDLTSNGASVVFGTNNITQDTGNLLIENTTAGGKLFLRLGDASATSEVVVQASGGVDKISFKADGSSTIPSLTVSGSGFVGTVLDVQGDAEMQNTLTVGGTSTLEGVTTITDATPTTSPTDGSLVVGGGLGISGDIRMTGVLYSNGTRQISDRRTKENIKKLEGCSNLIGKVPAYEYKYKNGKGLRRFGVMAQDIECIPELGDFVDKAKDGEMSVDYMNFIGLLIGGHQEMAQKINDLESQIKAMGSIN